MKNTEKIYKAIEMTENEDIKKILREFIMDNMPAPPKTKLQMKEFVSNDPYRMVLNHVCMDNEEKVAVATDLFKLFVSKDYYVNKGIDEPKTLCDIYGDIAKEKYVYPNWKAVIHTDNRPLVIRDDFEELIKKAETFVKENGIKRKVNESVSVQVSEDRWVRLDHAKLMVRVGLDGWEVSRNDDPKSLIKKWDGNTLLLMPVMFYGTKEELERGYFINEK